MSDDGRAVTSLVDRIHEVIVTARPMPLSASVLVNRDEMLDLLEQLHQAVPEEIRQARWLLKDREEFLARTQREADDILQAARTRAERMVQRTEITWEAERASRAMLEAAEIRSREMHHEAEDYVDQKLAVFEEVLNRTMHAVQQGRQQLQLPQPEIVVVDEDGVPAPFDQDHG